jgi:hypothetical protein
VTDLVQLCKDVEAFETPRWAVEAILDRECTTPYIVDPCAGLGMIGHVCDRHGLSVISMDKVAWNEVAPDLVRYPQHLQTDFLIYPSRLTASTVIMNPPFSLAEAFVDKARDLGARKIICFQRQAWRESIGRRAWWDANPPARVWVCGARATCWRFDLLACQHEGGEEACPNHKRKAKKIEGQGCANCLGGVPTSHAWYVWERGHKGAEVTSAIYPPEAAA